jgi:hypothetical protein
MTPPKKTKKTPKMKSLEDLISYRGTEMPDRKSAVLGMIISNTTAIKILLKITEKLVKEHEMLCAADDAKRRR